MITSPSGPSLPPALAGYRSWVFDCDGVLLDSNGVKTDAFRAAALPYGAAAADALCDYHRRHGGISRFSKADHLFETILGRTPEPEEKGAFLARFAEAVADGLATCAEAPGLRALLAAVGPGVPKAVVSGSEENELRAVLAARSLSSCFDAVLGSPSGKTDNLAWLRDRGLLTSPAVMLGDSCEDFQAASVFGMDFIFLSRWSTFDDWRNFFAGKAVRVVAGLDDLLFPCQA